MLSWGQLGLPRSTMEKYLVFTCYSEDESQGRVYRQRHDQGGTQFYLYKSVFFKKTYFPKIDTSSTHGPLHIIMLQGWPALVCPQWDRKHNCLLLCRCRELIANSATKRLVLWRWFQVARRPRDGMWKTFSSLHCNFCGTFWQNQSLKTDKYKVILFKVKQTELVQVVPGGMLLLKDFGTEGDR